MPCNIADYFVKSKRQLKPMKTKMIYVNGRFADLAQKRITHEEVCMFAFGPSVRLGVATITYFRGPKRKPEGSLQPGESVALSDKMAFTCVHTNKA